MRSDKSVMKLSVLQCMIDWMMRYQILLRTMAVRQCALNYVSMLMCDLCLFRVDRVAERTVEN